MSMKHLHKYQLCWNRFDLCVYIKSMYTRYVQ